MKSVIRKGGVQETKISSAALLHIISTVRLERLHESNRSPRESVTDKTKLKLDREVGGGCFFLFACLALFH